jgi:RNA polymerase sigma-70 factor (ECF subfamily)
VCLDLLRARKARREEPLDLPVLDPVASDADGADPEHGAVLADSVGRALLVLLDTLAPAERIAYVLHDLFAVPFDDIAPIVGRNPAAARKLASRARRRVQTAASVPHPDRRRQREAVEAFLAATRAGDFDGLLAVLDPDVEVRADAAAAPAGAPRQVHGAAAVAEQALAYSRRAEHARLALVNGAAGIVVAPHGRPITVMAFTVRNGRIISIDILADPARRHLLDLAVLN